MIVVAFLNWTCTWLLLSDLLKFRKSSGLKPCVMDFLLGSYIRIFLIWPSYNCFCYFSSSEIQKAAITCKVSTLTMLNPIGKYFKILLLWNIRIIWKQAWLECSLYGYLQNVCFCVNPSPKNVKMSTIVGHHSTNMGPYGKIIFKNSLIDINLSMYNHLIVPYKISIFVFKCWNMKLLLKKNANLFEPKLTSIFYW